MASGQYLDNRIIGKWIVAIMMTFFVGFTGIFVAHADSHLKAEFDYTEHNDGTVTFDGSFSESIDGPIKNYVWDFGYPNNGGKSGVNVTHCFPEQKTYTVGLTVVNDIGESDRREKEVRINVPPTCTERSVGKILNPLGDEISSIPEFLKELLYRIVQIALPIIVLFIIYAGFLFLTAQGNPEKISIAKKTLMWTLIGAAVIIGADILANVIVGTINDLGQ